MDYVRGVKNITSISNNLKRGVTGNLVSDLLWEQDRKVCRFNSCHPENLIPIGLSIKSGIC